MAAPLHILNLMFGRGKGGLEQAALDYHEALASRGHQVTTLLHGKAAMLEPMREAGHIVQILSPLAEGDPLAQWRLRRLIRQIKPDAVIAHGNRAMGLGLRAKVAGVPLIGVAHNYKIRKRLPVCDGALTITRDLQEELVRLNMPRPRMAHLPNLVRCAPTAKAYAPHTPPVIGTMGRFVAKKGFDVWLDALAILQRRGIAFHAIIGGQGEEEQALRAQAEQRGIAAQIEWAGWVNDKAAFFDMIDVFVLPSHHEPFGIVLIEAMAHGLPVITTASEGPCEIVTPMRDAWLVDCGDAAGMADALAQLIAEPELAEKLATGARHTALSRYDLPVIAEKLEQALRQLISTYQQGLPVEPSPTI